MCRLSVAAAGMLMLFSCTDKSYRGSADTQFSPEESRLVIMSVGNTDNIILKGSGAIENGDYDVWDGKPIYVYAFKRDLMTSFAATSMDDSESCLIDASRDELGSLAGKRAKVGMLDAYVVWDGIEKAVYYHPGNYPYDFYAYYIDNMEVPSEQISRTDDSVSFPVEIDGSTDFMSAKAELTEEQLYRQDFTDEERFDIINYAYSAYTAALDIHPVVYFKHLLTRLSFDIYPGREEANNVYIDSIKVLSRTAATFTVAHKQDSRLGLDFSGSDVRSPLWLAEPDGTRLRPGTYHTDYTGDFSEASIYDRDSVRVGGSLLVAPDTGYELHIYMTEIKNGVKSQPFEAMVELENSSGIFNPGEHYVVRLGIYGLYDVEFDAKLVPWTDGGSIIIDNDKPPAGSD